MQKTAKNCEDQRKTAHPKLWNFTIRSEEQQTIKQPTQKAKKTCRQLPAKTIKGVPLSSL